MWKRHNENPGGRNVGDCTVRAISAATGDSWMKTYLGLCIQGALMFNMPSADEVWGSYLMRKGWRRRFPREECPICYTVADFAREFPAGVYIVAVKEHVLVVIDGIILDTWDSSEEQPKFYWIKED